MTESLVALIAVVCVLVFWLIVMGIGLVQYILTSLALYTIADRRGIKNPWLAWLPVAYYWLLGSIADNYDETHGINRSWRKTLLILALIFIGGFTLCYAALFCVYNSYFNKRRRGRNTRNSFCCWIFRCLFCFDCHIFGGRRSGRSFANLLF